MRTVESVRAQDSAVIVHDPCSWGVGRRGKTTRTGAETGAGAAMPYFSLVPRTTWKATAPTNLSWRPDKTETTRHLIDPRHFQQKKVNDIKRKNVTHRVGLFYSRPDVGYYEAAPPPQTIPPTPPELKPRKPRHRESKITQEEVQWEKDCKTVPAKRTYTDKLSPQNELNNHSPAAVGRRGRMAEHYNTMLERDRIRFKRSQEAEHKEVVNDWITTNAEALKPRAYIPGIERCSWMAPLKHWSASDHERPLMGLANAATEYKASMNEKALREDLDDSGDEGEEETTHDRIFPDGHGTSNADEHVQKTPKAETTPLQPTSRSVPSTASSQSPRKKRLQETGVGANPIERRHEGSVRERRYVQRRHQRRKERTKRLWKLRTDMWKDGVRGGTTARDAFQEYPERLRIIHPQSMINGQLKFNGHFVNKTIHRDSFKPPSEEAVAWRAKHRGGDPVSDAPYHRLHVRNRWPSRQNKYEFLDANRHATQLCRDQPPSGGGTNHDAHAV